jgi:hypothetical protein
MNINYYNKYIKYKKKYDILVNQKGGEPPTVWWLEYYLATPICAFGRFTQSSGTCWCNTLLNILLLTTPLQKMLRDKYENVSQEKKQYIEKKYIKYEDFENSNDSLYILLYAVINLLLIQHKKPEFKYIDASYTKTDIEYNKEWTFVSQFACLIKNIYKRTKKLCSTRIYAVENGDGGDAAVGLIVALHVLFTFYEDFYIINQSYVKSFNIDKLKFLDYDESRILNKLKQSDKEEFICDISDVNFNTGSIPKILLITKVTKIEFKKIPTIINITIDPTTTKKYILHAATIIIDDKHAIAGLKCNDKYYIYDSNNFITYDDWYLNNSQQYIQVLIKYYEEIITEKKTIIEKYQKMIKEYNEKISAVNLSATYNFTENGKVTTATAEQTIEKYNKYIDELNESIKELNVSITEKQEQIKDTRNITYKCSLLLYILEQ